VIAATDAGSDLNTVLDQSASDRHRAHAQARRHIGKGRPRAVHDRRMFDLRRREPHRRRGHPALIQQPTNPTTIHLQIAGDRDDRLTLTEPLNDGIGLSRCQHAARPIVRCLPANINDGRRLSPTHSTSPDSADRSDQAFCCRARV
jgi:hypothetical protein